jgi:hypothetical protein
LLILAMLTVSGPANAWWFSSDDQPGYAPDKFAGWLSTISLANGTTCAADPRLRLMMSSGSRVLALRSGDGTCELTAGEWKDYYTGNIVSDAADVALTYIVPPKEAWNSGAFQWTTDQRARFASDPKVLALTTSGLARKRGDAGIGGWLPDDGAEACGYIRAYVSAKLSYGLTFTSAEIGVLKEYHKKTVKNVQGVASECTLYIAFDQGVVFGDSLKALPVRE